MLLAYNILKMADLYLLAIINFLSSKCTYPFFPHFWSDSDICPNK